MGDLYSCRYSSTSLFLPSMAHPAVAAVSVSCEAQHPAMVNGGKQHPAMGDSDEENPEMLDGTSGT